MYKESDLAGIAFHITMNTGQRISTKVTTAYFFGIGIPTNAQDVLQRPERKVYGRLLLRALSSLRAFSSCWTKTDVY